MRYLVRQQKFFSPIVLPLLALLLSFPVSRAAAGDQFRIGIMQAEKGAAEKFAPLEKYLRSHGVDVRFVETPSYTAAARMFAEGEVDGMFSGSGVAGCMLIKDVAYPLLRPVNKAGHSTYWAAVIAPKGAPKFTADGSYFKGKKVIFCALASSGEFYFHSLAGAEKAASEVLLAPSHGDAVKALADGKADVAIVKNWVWNGLSSKYPGLEQVGSDPEQNPDGTLIISNKADRKKVGKAAKALLALEADNGTEATEVRKRLNISKYIVTSAADFKHTLELLHKAGVGADFNFSF